MIIERIRHFTPQVSSHNEIDKVVSEQNHTETSEAVIFDEEKRRHDEAPEEEQSESHSEDEPAETNGHIRFEEAVKIAGSLAHVLKSGHSVELEA